MIAQNIGGKPLSHEQRKFIWQKWQELAEQAREDTPNPYSFELGFVTAWQQFLPLLECLQAVVPAMKKYAGNSSYGDTYHIVYTVNGAEQISIGEFLECMLQTLTFEPKLNKDEIPEPPQTDRAMG